MRPFLLPLLTLALLLAACGGESSDTAATATGGTAKLRKVRLLLNWYPEAEHGGFYAAKLLGFYEREGLDVEILPGGPDSPVVPRVAKGDVEFGVSNADRVLMGRAAGALVRPLMAPIQDSPRCVLVHEESGITSFDDLRNVTLSMSTADPFSQFLVEKYPLEGVRVVPYGGSVAPFVANKDYAVQGYSFSEPLIAQEQGARPRLLMLKDAGYNPYTSVLITSDELAKKDPQLIEAMTRASILGWNHYMADARATNAHIHEQNPEMSENALAFGVEALRPLVYPLGPGNPREGTMTKERWDELRQTLEDLEVIEPGSVTPFPVPTVAP